MLQLRLLSTSTILPLLWIIHGRPTRLQEVPRLRRPRCKGEQVQISVALARHWKREGKNHSCVKSGLFGSTLWCHVWCTVDEQKSVPDIPGCHNLYPSRRGSLETLILRFNSPLDTLLCIKEQDTTNQLSLILNDQKDDWEVMSGRLLDVFGWGWLNTLTGKLSKSCYSRDTPGGPTRGPYKVCDNLHSIARIKAEMPS